MSLAAWYEEDPQGARKVAFEVHFSLILSHGTKHLRDISSKNIDIFCRRFEGRGLIQAKDVTVKGSIHRELCCAVLGQGCWGRDVCHTLPPSRGPRGPTPRRGKGTPGREGHQSGAQQCGKVLWVREL